MHHQSKCLRFIHSVISRAHLAPRRENHAARAATASDCGAAQHSVGVVHPASTTLRTPWLTKVSARLGIARCTPHSLAIPQRMRTPAPRTTTSCRSARRDASGLDDTAPAVACARRGAHVCRMRIGAVCQKQTLHARRCSQRRMGLLCSWSHPYTHPYQCSNQTAAEATRVPLARPHSIRVFLLLLLPFPFPLLSRKPAQPHQLAATHSATH